MISYRGITHSTIEKPRRKQIQLLVPLNQLKIMKTYLSESDI